MWISVAICTWNRCELLGQTLEQMGKLVIPSDVEWELLVVNNNSTDATDNVITSFSGRLPIRHLCEPKPGKSHALNLAVREARGEYILWTDDDVLVDEQWIVEYCHAFGRWPEAALFGGPIVPWFAGNPPSWLEEGLPRIGAVFAVRDFGDEPVPFAYFATPYGANCAVRTDEQRRYRYDVNLGPRPNSMIRGEETALIRRMLADGVKGWWVPGARVRHYIPEERQTIRYLRAFFVGSGECLAQTSPDTQSKRLFGKPRWLWRQAVEAEVRYRLRRLFCEPELWMEDLKAASLAWGSLQGYNRMISHG